MESKRFVNGFQKSKTEGGIKLRIKMMRSRARRDDVEVVSSKESMTVPGYSTRAGDNDDVVDGDALPEHECKVCSKSFSSGRALAGHMRVHGGGASSSASHQSVGEAQITLNDLRNDSDGVGDVPPAAVKKKIQATTAGSVAVCVLCKKEFRSMKSLFGHMRTHKDRDWRGIQPPENFLSSSSSTVSNSEPKPESQISSWPVTSRRCKKRTLADSGFERTERDALPDSDDPTLDAAYDLLMLKNATAPLAAMDSSPSNDSDTKKKKKKKKKKLGALMGRLEKFRCNTCSKTFASHQALGGHKTSHRKDNLVTNAEEPQLEEEEEEEDDRPPLKKVELPPQVELDAKELQSHECKICHKRFPSGQALGGHKRCHWNEERAAMKLEAAESLPRDNTITKEEETTPATAVATTGSMLDLDLNEVAPLDDLDLDALYSMVEMVPAAAKLLGAEHAAPVTNPPTA